MINNTKEDHYFKKCLTEGRTVRTRKENKVRHHNAEMGHEMQRSYLYRALNIYNKIPRNITLIKSAHLFKKWIRKYNMDNTIKLKEQPDNNEEEHHEEDEEEESCYNIEDDIDEENENDRNRFLIGNI